MQNLVKHFYNFDYDNNFSFALHTEHHNLFTELILFHIHSLSHSFGSKTHIIKSNDLLKSQILHVLIQAGRALCVIVGNEIGGKKLIFCKLFDYPLNPSFIFKRLPLLENYFLPHCSP